VGKLKTTEQFIKEVIAVRGNRYDYSLVEYINGHAKIKIICKEHGVFKQTPSNHLNHNQDCNKCANNQQKTGEQFIQDAYLIHGDKYDYSLVKYITARLKIKILCPIHGVFEQTPTNHLTGFGCNYCGGNQQKTTAQFIQEAIMIHGDKYDYSLVEYINSYTKVKIICPTHGIFKQAPTNHIHIENERGCPTCTHRVSKAEIQWLNHIGLPDDDEHRQVRIGRYLVDGYDPATNTVYEFHGDYWHGNPDTTDHTKKNPTSKKSFKQLYEDTLAKEALIKDSGYSLVIMWESDWKNKNIDTPATNQLQ